MRISDELRAEFKARIHGLREHAEYCDGRVIELLTEADGLKAQANSANAKAQEIQDLLDFSEGGPRWQEAVGKGFVEALRRHDRTNGRVV
jgi:hypothetical protein